MDTVTFVVAVGALFFLLTCWAIIDIAQKDFGSLAKQATWGFIALIPFIGCLIYFIFGYRKGTKKSG